MKRDSWRKLGLDLAKAGVLFPGLSKNQWDKPGKNYYDMPQNKVDALVRRAFALRASEKAATRKRSKG
jgi:hypothetical protein